MAYRARRGETAPYVLRVPGLGRWVFPTFNGPWVVERNDKPPRSGEFWHADGAGQDAARRNLKEGRWE